MTDPHKDEHIEELLGKLQGIFGKLSHSEEEEAKQKIEIPPAAPGQQTGMHLHPKGVGAPKETPRNETRPPEPPPPPMAPPAPLNLYSDPAPARAPPVAVDYQSMVPPEDPERMIVPTAVYFPLGREAEAKSLAQKLETMTPKFTKVAFRLRVGLFSPYDPKGDWKETILLKSAEINFQTVFVAMDRPLEDGKRKAVAAELEGRNIYFQEVPLASIEKKAMYTDILLGLVFFFDSRKPPAGAEGP